MDNKTINVLNGNYEPISYSKNYVEQIILEKDKEIERLNNIIDELEKWLKNNIEYGDDDYYDMKAMGVELALNKLKELKEGK